MEFKQRQWPRKLSPSIGSFLKTQLFEKMAWQFFLKRSKINWIINARGKLRMELLSFLISLSLLSDTNTPSRYEVLIQVKVLPHPIF